MKQVIVEVDATGEIIIEAQGYEGDSCEEATKWLEEELGIADERQLKPEYFRQARLKQQGRLRNERPQ